MKPEPLVYITHEQHYFLSEQLPEKARKGKCANQQIRDEFEINPSPSQCHILGNLGRFLTIFSLIPSH